METIGQCEYILQSPNQRGETQGKCVQILELLVRDFKFYKQYILFGEMHVDFAMSDKWILNFQLRVRASRKNLNAQAMSMWYLETR